ncbi:hypothetical protein GF420_01490 [candidate division GN15 bacterium]|nr:hypothetical protein [candidate division GN15 bacterium]
MSKLDKLFLLINLLYSRRTVSLKTIQQVCQVPERTAYRYINTISEANIPVYYDRHSRTYQLNNRQELDIGSLDINEKVLVVVGLRLLAGQVGETYRNDIDRLAHKLFSRVDLPLEEIWQALTTVDNRGEDELEAPQLVALAKIYAAVLAQRSLMVVHGESGDNATEEQFESPAMQFRDEWRLVDHARPADSKTAPLSRILRLSIE